MIRFLEKKTFRQAIISIKALGFPALLFILLMFLPSQASSKQAAILDAIIDGETELSLQFIENQQSELLAKYFQLLKPSKIRAAQASVKKSIGPEICISARCLRLMSQTLGIETLFVLRMKEIARVGIGLDGVPLQKCRKRGIRVSWTPDAVTRAVAELTVGQMLSSSRFVRMLDAGIRKQQWSRPAGRGIRESIIGLIGFGRIGSSVARLLGSFSPEQILVKDIADKTSEIQALQQQGLKIISAGLEEILESSHIISLHVPLWKETRHMIGVHELEMMRQDAMLINTARGGIVDETALRDALEKGFIAGAAIDVFEKEPYSGPLSLMENCILTPHLGSCTLECRARMESESLNEALRFLQGDSLLQEVPDAEYVYQE